MAIQIFGSKKSNESKKAERWFKERGIKVQYIDMSSKGMSCGELTSVLQAVGGLQNLLDPNCKDKNTLALIQYLLPEAQLEKVLENPQVLKTPVVRSGKNAVVGFCPEIWQAWL